MDADYTLHESGISVASLTLAGGAVVHLPPSGVTAVVGGNNVGKSTLLQQVNQLFASYGRPVLEPGRYRLVTGVQLEKRGTAETFRDWLVANSSYLRPTPANPNIQASYTRPQSGGIQVSSIESQWNQIVNGYLGPLTGFLVRSIEAGNRSGQPLMVSRKARPDDPPSELLQYLEDDLEKWCRLQEIYQDVFGADLTLDKLSQNITLRIGTAPEVLSELGYETHDKDLIAREALDALPMVGMQGDGIRSLMAVLLPPLTASYPIILIDEPELFLHPPQALKVGRILGDLSREQGVQIILATHDRNILGGLLESNCRLSIVRLDRSDGSTEARVLDDASVKEIWADSVLRYSNVLDGLFHRLVVTVENDRDCKFYAAALEAAHEESPLPISPSEVLFVPTYGKEGMRRVISAFVAVGVHVVASPDLDMLDDRVKLRQLVEALGVSWDPYESEYNACTAYFRSPPGDMLVSEVRNEILGFLDRVVDEDPRRKWDGELKRRLNFYTRAGESRWNSLKRDGVGAFPHDVGSRPTRLLDRFDEIGIVMVRVGTLESFGHGYDNMTRKGPSWVPAAIAAGVHLSRPALDHVRRLLGVGFANSDADAIVD